MPYSIYALQLFVYLSPVVKGSSSISRFTLRMRIEVCSIFTCNMISIEYFNTVTVAIFDRYLIIFRLRARWICSFCSSLCWIRSKEQSFFLEIILSLYTFLLSPQLHFMRFSKTENFLVKSDDIFLNFWDHRCLIWNYNNWY